MKVKVWNDNVHPYNEVFKGEKIHIPPRSFIEMEHGEAMQFKGTFAPMKRDVDGNDLPEGYKMIRVEEPAIEDRLDTKLPDHLCLACRYLGKSKGDLLAHIHSAHAEQFAIDEDAETEIRRKKAKAG